MDTAPSLAPARARPLPAGVLPWLAVAVIALGAAAAVLLMTRHAMGLSNDSALYLGSADNLLHGHGLKMPYGRGGPRALTHFPPLYPLALAALGAAGLSLVQAARWLGAVLYAANVALAAAAVRRAHPRARAAPVLAALLTAVAGDLLFVHAMAWSEPLYLALTTAAFILVAGHLRADDGRTARAAAAGALLGLAWLTRYVGAAPIAAAVLALLLGGARGRRVRDAAVAAAFACAPMAAWMARNRLVGGAATNRELAWHPPTLATLKVGWAMGAWWLLPTIPYRNWIFLAVAVIAAAVLALRAGPVRAGLAAWVAEPLARVLVLHIAFYAALLAVSISLFDATTPLDLRILSPVLVSGVVLLGCAVARRETRGRLAGGWTVLAAYLVVMWGVRTAVFARRWGAESLYYASREWRASPLLARLRALPPGTPIYTNLPEAVYLLAGRESNVVPMRYSHLSRRANPRYRMDVAALAARGTGYVAIFSGIDRPYLAPEAELVRSMPLELVARERDGRLYRFARADRNPTQPTREKTSTP